jgi:hypothetical protein
MRFGLTEPYPFRFNGSILGAAFRTAFFLGLRAIALALRVFAGFAERAEALDLVAIRADFLLVFDFFFAAFAMWIISSRVAAVTLSQRCAIAHPHSFA